MPVSPRRGAARQARPGGQRPTTSPGRGWVAGLLALGLLALGLGACGGEAEREGTQAGAEPEVPVELVDIRTEARPGVDRVVFEFASALPTYEVEYVDPLRAPGSGRVVAIAGAQTLRVTFTGVAPPSPGLDRLPPEFLRLPQVEEVVFLGGFEAMSTAGIGISSMGRIPFEVRALSDPPRVAIDVAHTDMGDGRAGSGG